MKDWKKYIFEFIVIFISITLSFIVDEWRSDLAEKRERRKILIEVRNEIKAYVELGEKFGWQSKVTDSISRRISSRLPVNNDSITYMAIMLNAMCIYSGSGLEHYKSKFPNFYFLLGSDWIGKLENNELLANTRIMGMQLGNMASTRQSMASLAGKFNSILIMNNLVTEWENLNSLNYQTDSLTKLLKDDNFIYLIDELRVFRASEKAYEDFLVSEAIPKIIEQLDKELNQ